MCHISIHQCVTFQATNVSRFKPPMCHVLSHRHRHIGGLKHDTLVAWNVTHWWIEMWHIDGLKRDTLVAWNMTHWWLETCHTSSHQCVTFQATNVSRFKPPISHVSSHQCVTFQAIDVSHFNPPMCHVSSHQCVMFQATNVSRFNPPMCHVSSHQCVTFQATNVSCFKPPMCHVSGGEAGGAGVGCVCRGSISLVSWLAGHTTHLLVCEASAKLYNVCLTRYLLWKIIIVVMIRKNMKIETLIFPLLCFEVF